jgi:hypothetical protein
MFNKLKGEKQMDYKSFTFAGWVTIVNAIATIPVLATNIFLEAISRQIPAVNLILIMFTTIIIIVNTFIFYKFRELLNSRFQFHDANNLILVIILANVLIGFLNILGFMFPPIQMVMKITIMILLVPFGISFIAYAVQLLKLKNELFGFLKPYAYVTIAVGVCVMTVILFVMGVLIGVAAGLMQGLILLKSAEELEFV